MRKSDLVERVKLAISSKVPAWVLFSNGTVIVFDDPRPEYNLEENAVNMMKEFGPVYIGTEAGDFRVVGLGGEREGWLVTGHCRGMYTYVHPSELENKNPDAFEIGMHGRSKREKDGEQLRILHVYRKT